MNIKVKNIYSLKKTLDFFYLFTKWFNLIGYEAKPFVDFLRSRKLTSNVEHYVVHAIAMVDEKCLTLEVVIV